jgi:hypothetical protein
MKTFIINEVRFNEKDEAFEVKTKMQFESIDLLLRYLNDNTRILWNGTCAIQDEEGRIIRRYRGIQSRRAQSKELPYAEGTNGI